MSICSLWKSDSLILLESWQLDLKIYITLFGFALKKESESLFLKRRREQIALVALVALLKRMKRIIRSCRSFKKSEKSDSLFWKCKEAIHSFLSKDERFARKTKERIPHPDYNLKYQISCLFWRKTRDISFSRSVLNYNKRNKVWSE